MFDWLATRAIAEEQMDAADLPLEVYAAVLCDLARVNTVTLAARPTLAFLDRMVAGGRRIEPLRILDVGFGCGDMLRSIAQWARKREVPVTLTGIDLNPNSVPIALALTSPEDRIRFLTGDATELSAERWDVILSSLVAHHMTDDQRRGFLTFMEARAERGWFVNDLARNRFAHLGYPALARLLRVHPIVRADGRLSIARSFRREDWHADLAATGLAEVATIEPWFPFRLCVARAR